MGNLVPRACWLFDMKKDAILFIRKSRDSGNEVANTNKPSRHLPA